MRHYRLYHQDDRGHIYLARDIESADDQAARSEAENASSKDGVEVWERSRLVARFARAGENQAA